MRHRRDRIHAVLALMVVQLSLLAGCAGQFATLRPQKEIEHLAALDHASRSLHRDTSLVVVGEAEGKPVRLAMEEVGHGSGDRMVVMIHGVLSDRRVWRFVAGDLGRDHRLLLVDLPGAGESDLPAPKAVGPDGYSPTALARSVLFGLRNRFGEGEAPESIALVGHSLGGAVILRMMGDPELRESYSDIVGRVDRVVMLAPLDFAVEKAHPEFDKIASLGRLKVGLARVLRVLKNEVGRSSREGSVDPRKVPREEARRMLDILRRGKTRRPAQAMIRQAVPFHRKTKRPDWDAIERLEADYANVGAPTLILWGARDETLPVSMGYKLRAQLEDARLRVIEDSMHSLPTERPGLCADYIRRFVRDGGEEWERVAVRPVGDGPPGP